MSKSFVMLKPECIEENLTDKVISQIVTNQFVIEKKEEEIVSRELILEHYKEVIDRFGDEFREKVLNHFEGKKVIKMIVSKPSGQSIDEFRKLVGATQPTEAKKGTIRNNFSKDSYEKAEREQRVLKNIIHASDSEESARKEIALWFYN